MSVNIQSGNERDRKISKKLSFLLRHGAVKRGLNIRADGFVKVSELLKVTPECSLVDLQRIVAADEKQRYTLHSDDSLWIKANQGHTIAEVNSLSLRPLTEVSFSIVHGTYFSCYDKIKSQGISRMKRNHIHFAKGLDFVTGLRKSAEIYIYIDFSRASEDGIKFYESENKVILSPGDLKGYIQPKYFLKVTTRTGKDLE